MDINITNTSASVSVVDRVFAAEYNHALVYQVVTAYLTSGRAGTKAQKTRSEVSGGGAKPWKQKGTGRARAGTIRSPIWRSGGVTFAAKPRDFSQKVNKKMYRAALRSIFSELVRQERLKVVESFELDSHKTKDFVTFVNQNNLGQDVLLISESANNKVYMAAHNLPCVTLVDVQAINPALLLRHENIAVDKAAIEKINEWLS